MKESTKDALLYVAGGTLLLGGGIGLLKLLGKKSTSQGGAPNFSQNPELYYVSDFPYEEIGNGWRLLDVRAIQSVDPDRDAHVGMTASLLLSNRGAEPRVFNAKILQISGNDFSGKWAGGGPAGGPQMIDFSGFNIFALHA